jgi:hypothetical protein
MFSILSKVSIPQLVKLFLYNELRHVKCNPGGIVETFEKVTLRKRQEQGGTYERKIEMGISEGDSQTIPEGGASGEESNPR